MSTIKFYKDSNGAFRLTDCTGKLAYINKGDIVSAYAENGVCSMIFSDEVYNRFTNIHNKNTVITDFVNASSVAYDEAGLNAVLSDFFVKSAGGISSGVEVINALGYTPEDASKKGAAGGYAPLDSGSKVPAVNLPSALAVGAIEQVESSSTDKAPSSAFVKNIIDASPSNFIVSKLFDRNSKYTVGASITETTTGKYLNLSGGESSAAGFFISDYYLVSDYKSNLYIIRNYQFNISAVVPIVFYDSNNNVLAVQKAVDGNSKYNYTQFVPPVSAVKFRISAASGYQNNFLIVTETEKLAVSDFSSFKNNAISSDNFESYISYIDITETTTGKYLNTSGGESSDTNYFISGYYLVSDYVNKMVVAKLFLNSINLIGAITYYDLGYNVISTKQATGPNNSYNYLSLSEFPSGAVYFRVTGRISKQSKILIKKAQIPAVTNKVISWIGDSITVGLGSTAGNHYYDFVSSIIFSSNLVYGSAGSCISYWSSRSDAVCTRFSSMSTSTDIVCMLAGINDWGNSRPLGSMSDSMPSVDTDCTTFYKALKFIANGMINKFGTNRIVFITPVNSYGYYFSGNSDKDVNELGLKIEDYCKAIKDVAEYYSIPVIDLNKESGVTARNSTLSTYFFADGVHPNDVGCKYMGLYIAKKMKDNILI